MILSRDGMRGPTSLWLKREEGRPDFISRTLLRIALYKPLIRPMDVSCCLELRKHMLSVRDCLRDTRKVSDAEFSSVALEEMNY
jgi:hypothetical protein